MLEKFNKKKAVLDMMMDHKSVCLIDENGELIMFTGNTLIDDSVKNEYYVVLSYNTSSKEYEQDNKKLLDLKYDRVEQDNDGAKEIFMRRDIYFKGKLYKISSMKYNKDNSLIMFKIDNY